MQNSSTGHEFDCHVRFLELTNLHDHYTSVYPKYRWPNYHNKPQKYDKVILSGDTVWYMLRSTSLLYVPNAKWIISGYFLGYNCTILDETWQVRWNYDVHAWVQL